MTAFDLVALTVPDRYPELPRTPARVVGEQIRHGTPLVRLSWPNNQAAWVPAADVVPVARAA
jgi:hypothetical protein